MNISHLHRTPGHDDAGVFAILLFGILAFRALPVAALPSVDYPTIQVTAGAARRRPGNHGLVRCHAARTRVLHHRRREADEFPNSQGTTTITVQFT